MRRVGDREHKHKYEKPSSLETWSRLSESGGGFVIRGEWKEIWGSGKLRLEAERRVVANKAWVFGLFSKVPE